MKKKDIMIGINWEQNSTAALMIDGQILACVSEERFTRVKNDERYPKKAIDWLISEFDIKKKDISKVCVISDVWAPGYTLTRHYTQFSINDYIKEQKDVWYQRIYNKKKVSQVNVFKNKIDLNQYPGKKFWIKILNETKKQIDHVSNQKIIEVGKKIRSDVIKKHLNVPEKKIFFIDHSTGHAAFSYFSRRKKESSLVLTLDAFGDYVNYTAWKFTVTKGTLTYKKFVSGGNFIIGRLYRYITLILGLKPNEHEYKVMGLAPYCKDKYFINVKKIFQKFQNVKGLKFNDVNKPKDLYFDVKKKIDGQRFDAIAGGLQSYTEDLIIKWVKNCIKRTKLKSITLAGGVAMNVKTNLLISKINKKVNLFVPPSPDDSSQAMGACYAYYLLYKKNEIKKLKPLKDAYLGPSAKISLNIKKKFKQKKYRIIKKNINQVAAKLLLNNKIIARFCGRAEFGARALGNRSILASPLSNSVKIKINENVKNRDFWMPFAASVLANKSKKYFMLNSDYESYNYMTNCVETTELGKKFLKAAIHPYDKTCRPQIINKNQNKSYENLIKQFGDISGVYGLLNTSFNLHGYPIVNEFDEVSSVFINSNLDGLLLDDCLIIKK